MDARWFGVFGGLLLALPALAQVPAVTMSKAATAVHRAQITQDIASARVERVAPDRAALSVVTKADAAKKLRLVDAKGSEIATTRTDDGVIKASIDPRRWYALVPQTSERKTMTRDNDLQFPARYVTVTSAGVANLGGLFLRAAVVPLTWNDQLRAYATELLVGYEFDDGAERDLPVTKTINFFAEGANASIKENTVVVTRSGPSGYKRVVLSTGQVEGETLFSARAGVVDELQSSVTVLREAGRLKLTLPSTELPAFGVGSGELTVTLISRDGMPLAPTQPLEIQLSSRRLRQPPLLVLEPGKPTAVAEIRTTGYGADEIVAQSGALRGSLPVRMIFPVAATVAAVGGGVLGGAARYLRNRYKRRPLLVRRLVEGALVGLIIVGAAWTGMVSADMSAGVLGTPFGALVLGALSGYLGCVLLDRVANRAFGGLKAEA